MRIDARMSDGGERTWRARFFVDASGRDTFLANRFGIKRRNRSHNSAAIYGHFTGAQRLPGKAAGNISMFWFDLGAEFNSPEHGPPVTFDFSQAWDKTYPNALEVRRSEFDEILFRNCGAKGARTFEE